MYGIISIDMSIVLSFKKKNESLLRLILFISLLDRRHWFTLSLRESFVICWKSMILITSSNIYSISARWCWLFFVLITCKIGIQCRIPGIRPTYLSVNVGQIIFSNSLVKMLPKSLVNILAKSLVNELAGEIVIMLVESLMNMLIKSLKDILVEALVNMLAEALINILT